MSQNSKDDVSQSAQTENIFDELSNSAEIKQEIEKADKVNEKDIYYYLKKISGLLMILNIVTLLFILLGAYYIYVQQSDERKEYSYLAPICSLFVWSNAYFPNTCYGITYALNDYSQKLETETQKQVNLLLPLVGEVYSLENFNLSRKMSFILEKSKDRLKPKEILENFDLIKNAFSPTDKWELQCYDITISNNILSATCDAYSSDWNTDILTVRETTLVTLPWWGTSVSKASSFLYFLENYAESSFEILEKPRSFSSESVQIAPYTQKTTFQFQLLYKEDGNIYQIN